MWVKICDELINTEKALEIYKEDYSTEFADIYKIRIFFSHYDTTIDFDSETDRDIAFAKLASYLVKN